MEGSKPNKIIPSSQEDLFPPLDHLTLKSSQAPGVLQIEGRVPQWLYNLGLGQGKESSVFEFLQQSHIFPHVIRCAQEFWDKSEEGQWRSGPLQEPQFMGENIRLEAIAFRIGAEKFLHIKKLGIEFEELCEERQKQREVALHEKERQEQSESDDYHGPDLIGKSQAMQNLYSQITEFAFGGNTILIEGEPGTGKTLLAQAIHHSGPRRSNSFVVAQSSDFEEHYPTKCQSFQATSTSSDWSIFKLEIVQRAIRGTLLVRSYENMPEIYRQRLWAQLLPTHPNAKIGENSIQWILAVSFRLPELQDILSRTCLNWIQIPPLRNRRDDIPLLSIKFLAEQRVRNGRWRIQEIGTDAMELLYEYSWPGNVTELRQVIYYAFERCREDKIRADDLPSNIQQNS